MQAAGWIGEFIIAETIFESLKRDSAGLTSLAIYGASLAFQSRRDESLALMQDAIQAESGSALVFYRLSNIAVTHFTAGDYGAATEYARRAVASNDEFFMAHLTLIAALQCLEENDKAAVALQAFRNIYTDPTLSEFRPLPFTDPKVMDTFFTALRDAGMPK